MIVLFSDFGADDIYVAQVKAVLLERLAGPVPVLDLLHAAPSFRIDAAAHLLAALQAHFPRGAVFLAVVDPGVGTSREAAVVQADGKWYVGPDNGLLSVTAARAADVRTWRIRWRPPVLSASFHGRDLFAPIAASIARSELPEDKLEPTTALQVQLGPRDLAQVIYIDHYGNALTGLRAAGVPRNATIGIRGQRVAYARIFAEAQTGEAFWYENSIGLVEIASRRASAAKLLGIALGDPVSVLYSSAPR
jgi:S-adenosyl-L-methionine hydrolase (adenosine-forming)